MDGWFFLLSFVLAIDTSEIGKKQSANNKKKSQLARQLNRGSPITISTTQVELGAVKFVGYKHRRAKCQPTTRETKQLMRRKNTAKFSPKYTQP